MFFFICRRVLFVFVTLFLWDKVWVQLFALQVFAQVAIIYLGLFRPFTTLLMQRLEMFNEAINLLLIGVLFCFTDFVRNEEDRETVGLVFLAIFASCLAVHLFFIIRGTVIAIIYKLKMKRYATRMKAAKKYQIAPAPKASTDWKRLIRDRELGHV